MAREYTPNQNLGTEQVDQNENFLAFAEQITEGEPTLTDKKALRAIAEFDSLDLNTLPEVKIEEGQQNTRDQLKNTLQ